MSSYTAEATEQVVKIAMQGAEIALRIAGAGAAKTAALLRAVFSDDRKTAGRTRIANLLRTGEEIRVFTVKDSDLVRFSREARRYGVSYTVVKDRTAGDGTADILVKSGEAARVNRVIARCGLSAEEPDEEAGSSDPVSLAGSVAGSVSCSEPGSVSGSVSEAGSVSVCSSEEGPSETGSVSVGS